MTLINDYENGSLFESSDGSLIFLFKDDLQKYNEQLEAGIEPKVIINGTIVRKPKLRTNFEFKNLSKN